MVWYNCEVERWPVVLFYHKTRTPIMAAQRARVPLNAIGIYWSIGTFVHSSLWWNPACASNNSKQLRQLQLKWLPQMHAVTCRFGTVWWMSGLSLQPQIVIHLRGNLLQHKRPRFQWLLKLEILHRWFPPKCHAIFVAAQLCFWSRSAFRSLNILVGTTAGLEPTRLDMVSRERQSTAREKVGDTKRELKWKLMNEPQDFPWDIFGKTMIALII